MRSSLKLFLYNLARSEFTDLHGEALNGPIPEQEVALNSLKLSWFSKEASGKSRRCEALLEW